MASKECTKLEEWIKNNVSASGTAQFSVVTHVKDGKLRDLDVDPNTMDHHDIIFNCEEGDDLVGHEDYGAMIQHVVDNHWSDAGFSSKEAAKQCVDPALTKKWKK